MNRFILTCAFAAASALACASAQAGVGMTQLPGVQGDNPVTVFYPTDAKDEPQQFGPFTIDAARNAQPVRGNGRLIAISHGSGGNFMVHSNLARELVNEGFVVAFPRHRGDNAQDSGTPGPESWKIRPLEVSHAIDAVAKDARFASLLSLDKVGMYGMSAGGHTALSLAGGRWSPGNFKRHCEQHIAEDFPSCVGLITQLKDDMLDGVKKTVAVSVIRHRFDDDTWQQHTDPRIVSVVAAVPSAADFDAQSLAQPKVALGFVTARKDKWLAPRFHSDAILSACKTCVVVADLPTGGHGAMLSPPPPKDVLGPIEQDLLLDPPGFDRATIAPQVDRAIGAFFKSHLL